MDELLWGAMWLYKATDNEEYLKYVINMADLFGGIGWAISEFSWDVKYAGVQVMASKVLQFISSNNLSQVFDQTDVNGWCNIFISSIASFTMPYFTALTTPIGSWN